MTDVKFAARPDIRVFVEGKYDGLMMREVEAEVKLRMRKEPIEIRVFEVRSFFLEVIESACGVLVLQGKAADPRLVREALEALKVLDPRARPAVFIRCVPSDASIVMNDVQEFLESVCFKHGFWYPEDRP